MAEKEKKLTFDDVKKKLEDIEKLKLSKKQELKKKISYLKEAFLQAKEQEDPRLELEIGKELIKLVKKNPICTYHLVYDSIGEGVEPIYYWTLDYMREEPPSGMGLEVTKVEEGFEASVTSGFFGEMGARAGVLQDRAMKILETINAVIKSIINIIYDLKDFEIRLQTYDELHSKDPEKRKAARLALKGIWMDMVDIKRGRASINMLAQQLDFITLRDAFMMVNSEKEIEALDVNRRVKNILHRKLNEYLKWEKLSEEELRKRFNIEKSYLATQIDSLKLYAKWIKPYLKAAQKLGMKEFNVPDIVTGFSGMVMELSLFGKREIKPEDVHTKFAKVKLDRKYYACVGVDFKFRTLPQAMRTERGTQYINTGRTEILFNGYALDDIEVEAMEKQELYEDMELVENLTGVSLKELQKDIEHFLKKEEKKEEKEKKPISKEVEEQIKSIGKGFKEALSPLTEVGKTFKSIFKPVRLPLKTSFVASEVEKAAKEQAKDLTYQLYDVYKKAHGMLTW